MFQKVSKFSNFSNFQIFKFQNFKKYSEIRGATSISDAFIYYVLIVSRISRMKIHVRTNQENPCIPYFSGKHSQYKGDPDICLKQTSDTYVGQPLNSDIEIYKYTNVHIKHRHRRNVTSYHSFSLL